jgi:hypothetical protein
VLQIVDGMGRVKPAHLVSALIRRPALLIQLIRLGHSAQKAEKSLGKVVREVVKKPPP